MTVTLVVPDRIALELNEASGHPLETAGVLFVSVLEADDGIRLLARGIRWVEESAYLRRESDSLSIASNGYVHSLGEAENLGATAVWFHTHPGVGSSPVPSRHDIVVDDQLSDLFRLRTGSRYYVSLIVSPRENGIEFTGRIQRDGGAMLSIDRIWVVGERLKLIDAFGSHEVGLSPALDRNIRAFGGAVQSTLASLHIGIAGCGGTGSIIAEQLVRLGVQQFTLVDPEDLSVSNVTRLYGSAPDMVGKPKVEIVGDHLRGINPEARIAQIKSTITIEAVARRFLGCDVVFGCTDDNAGRLVLSRLATYLLVPVIDCGVLLTADDASGLTGIDGRVTTLVPGQACLVCRGRIDLSRAAAESLTPGERVRRADEGYAPALGRIEPAVVAYTTAVGAAAVCELLDRLIGYGPEPRSSEILLRLHDREISTNRAIPRDHHYCNEKAGKLGIGITQPFLDQTWSA